MSDDARLSKLLFEARELIDMHADLVESRISGRDAWSRRVRDEIDDYRRKRGWSPHGFGGEDDRDWGAIPVLDVHATDPVAEGKRYADAVERWAATRGTVRAPDTGEED